MDNQSTTLFDIKIGSKETVKNLHEKKTRKTLALQSIDISGGTVTYRTPYITICHGQTRKTLSQQPIDIRRVP